ncbi:acyltransferase [Sphingobacterium faecale]|uniref:Acyltransferase family protein n=1 Tax=Sphingobacterium faecale TaxID=2803775 RepID=A0ABS1R7D5_9SPHI|nr:acyltransferase family protein [Sphingobacterium faecale]MBL1410631.1 acyltransferase family protein [Sphingobacterium faecale]
MAEKNRHIIYLRVIATVFVVLIHASTGFLYRVDTNSFDWNYANWINAATRCSVPLFVVISGALLLQKDENIWDFYKKRLPKLLFPFLFWTIVYLIYYFYRYTNFENLSSEKIWAITQDKLLHGANAHLWYLYMIIGLYLTIPFLRKILVQCSIKEIEWFLLLWLLSMFVSNRAFYSIMPKFDLTFFSGYIGYLVLGHYLTIKSFHWNKLIAPLGYIIITTVTAMGTCILNEKATSLNTLLYNYVFPNTAIAAVFLFLSLQPYCLKVSTIPRWITIVDKYSFGIYLSHIIPLNFLHPFFSRHADTVWVIPLASISTIVVSVFLTFILRKLPYGRYISG